MNIDELVGKTVESVSTELWTATVKLTNGDELEFIARGYDELFMSVSCSNGIFELPVEAAVGRSIDSIVYDDSMASLTAEIVLDDGSILFFEASGREEAWLVLEYR